MFQQSNLHRQEYSRRSAHMSRSSQEQPPAHSRSSALESSYHHLVPHPTIPPSSTGNDQLAFGTVMPSSGLTSPLLHSFTFSKKLLKPPTSESHNSLYS